MGVRADMSFVFVFTECPPGHLLALRQWGFHIVSTVDCPGLEKVVDVKSYIRDKFAVVVGDKRLAEELRVGAVDVGELEEFLGWLSGEGARLFKAALQ